MATPLCALARAKLARAVASVRDATTRERVTTAMRAGFVGGIVTPARAVVGNASWGGLRALVLQPAEAAFDHLFSVARSARTGFTVAPSAFREVASALDVRGLRAMGRGFRAGTAPVVEAARAAQAVPAGTPFGARIRTFVDELSARLEADPQAAQVLEPTTRVTYRSPTLQTMVDAAFAAVEAADRPFYRLAFDGSLYMQAKLYAITQGLRGAERGAEIDRLLAAPTDEMVVRATDDAQHATFKDPTALGAIARGAKRAVKQLADQAPDPAAAPYVRGAQAARQAGAKVADLALELNVPFVGVPSAVAARSAGMTPLGVLSLVTDQTQAQRARTLAHVSLGAAGIYAGLELYRAGRITGPRPTDPRQGADDRAAGRIPFAVKVGDTWVGAASLGPAAAPLFMGAALGMLRERHPDAGAAEQAVGLSGSVGAYLTEQTYLTNVRRLVEAAQSPDKVPGLVASQIPTPSLLGQLARAADPVPREARTFGERLLDRVPGGNAALPHALGPFGELPPRTPLERAGAVLSPFPLSPDRETPVQAELRRLGVPVGMPDRALVVRGHRVEMPRAMYAQALARFGAMATRVLGEAFADPRFRALDDEAKRHWLHTTLPQLRAAALTPARGALWSVQDLP